MTRKDAAAASGSRYENEMANILETFGTFVLNIKVLGSEGT